MAATIEIPDSVAREIVAIRRDLHVHPELGFHEDRTAGIIAARLRELGVDEVHERIATTGVIGVLHGGKPGRTVMLRADMDALPMPEEKDVPYRSRTPNVMHACGHDGHVAMLLGAAEVLVKRRAEVPGTIVFCFQPAEEGGGGARVMVEEGVLERFGVERAYGLHLVSVVPTGVMTFRGGPLMASVDEMRVEITGHGGHGAMPHHSVDPILVAADFITSVQRVVSRHLDPTEPAVVSVCSMHAGTTSNVIPSTAELLGTIRTFSEATRDEIPRHIERILKASCDSAGASYLLDITRQYPVTINDHAQTAFAKDVAQRYLGADLAVDGPAVMGAEDFSYFAQRVPASFIFLGCRGGESTGYPNHNARFDMDERALETGVAMHVALALEAPAGSPG
jgi:amidohydrolase